ncbi:hypothetical protein [Humibacillus sp. DSM 29435]|uniref:hypothetical protein n=1 Tax=Humibacillus sp. DSM 29435 TaxID=1869167 RepID=UPI0015865EEE|nr:hypothetical protein [Humibacillus sp. DSM 29435]
MSPNWLTEAVVDDIICGDGEQGTTVASRSRQHHRMAQGVYDLDLADTATPLSAREG